MSTAAILVLAMLLDAALGEPAWLWRRLPHPAVLMGRLIGWGDQARTTEMMSFLLSRLGTERCDPRRVCRKITYSACLDD